MNTAAIKEGLPLPYIAIFWCIVVLGFAPWLYFQFIAALNADVAWNVLCAQRFLLTNNPWHKICYDMNPPLSTFVYIPAVLWSKILSFPVYDSIYFTTLSFMILWFILTERTLRKLPSLCDAERLVFMTAFMASLTLVANTFNFAERDLLVGLTLVPFSLTQLLITHKIALPKRINIPLLVVGAFFLMVKPHFGLIPISLLLHRMLVQKKIFGILMDVDFLILSCSLLIYFGSLFLFFPDFIFVVLPDIFAFYLPNNDLMSTLLRFQMYGLATILTLVYLFLIPEKSNKIRFIIFLLVMSLLGLFGYIVQRKGFYYQLLPALAFLCPAYSLLFFQAVCSLLRRFKIHDCKKYSFILSVLAIFSICYVFFPMAYALPTHNDFKNSALTKYLQKNCPSPCSLMITGEDMTIVNQTALYAGAEYASRFPSLWFMPAYADAPTFTLQHVNLEDTHKRLAGYVADDMLYYQPDLLMIFNTFQSERTSVQYDYMKFLQVEPRIREIMKNYENIGSFSENEGLYFQGTAFSGPRILVWDVYKRKQNY